MGTLFEIVENSNINKNEEVSVKYFEATNEIDVVSVSNKNRNNFSDIVKLNKDEYLIKSTGEIRKYAKHKKRTKSSLNKTLKNIKDLIRNNFKGGSNEIYVTLTTVDDDMQSIDAIKSQFKKFWRRLKSKYKNLEYLYIIEKSSRMHIHLLIRDKNENSVLYIDNEEIQNMWEKGYTKTARVTEIDGLKDYFSKFERKGRF